MDWEKGKINIYHRYYFQKRAMVVPDGYTVVRVRHFKNRLVVKETKRRGKKHCIYGWGYMDTLEVVSDYDQFKYDLIPRYRGVE